MKHNHRNLGPFPGRGRGGRFRGCHGPNHHRDHELRQQLRHQNRNGPGLHHDNEDWRKPNFMESFNNYFSFPNKNNENQRCNKMQGEESAIVSEQNMIDAALQESLKDVHVPVHVATCAGSGGASSQYIKGVEVSSTNVDKNPNVPIVLGRQNSLQCAKFKMRFVRDV